MADEIGDGISILLFGLIVTVFGGFYLSVEGGFYGAGTSIMTVGLLIGVYGLVRSVTDFRLF